MILQAFQIKKMERSHRKLRKASERENQEIKRTMKRNAILK